MTELGTDDVRTTGNGGVGKRRALLTLGVAALLIGTGCTTGGRSDLAGASGRPQSRVDLLTDKAEVAIAERHGVRAVRYAERAVALAPTDARCRALLAHAYLHAGRFVSAAQAAEDALRLDAENSRAALDLALAQTALGDWTAARETLTRHAAILKPADRGLALALAGDPLGGAVVIGEAARGPAASATARQNLALALALGGRWQDARAVAAVDLRPDELQRRMETWQAFVQPMTSSQQVATLLGTAAVRDAGQPIQLALARPAVEPPVAVAEVPAQPEVAQAEPAEPVPPAIRFAPRQEIVQPIQVAAVRPPAAPVRVAPAVPGHYYVQLGAFENAASAEAAWLHVRQRHSSLAGLSPFSGEAHGRGGSIHRLSVGGFQRAEAMARCERLRAEGGRCFVRERAGDRVAAWAGGERQLAAR